MTALVAVFTTVCITSFQFVATSERVACTCAKQESNDPYRVSAGSPSVCWEWVGLPNPVSAL